MGTVQLLLYNTNVPFQIIVSESDEIPQIVFLHIRPHDWAA